MKKPAILVTGADLAPEAAALLGDFELVYGGTACDEETLVSLARKHEPVAIIVRYGKIPARVMDASPRLRVISKHGTGIDTIDSAAAAQRGIEVRAALGANSAAVAEHAWALILACAKDIAKADRRMREGHWDKPSHRSLELDGKTLGVVGLGAIGRRVASIGVAFGMRVIAFDPFAPPPPPGVQLRILDEVFAQSHVLSLNCPLTGDTRHLVNRASIARMRDGVVIVNTGRGGLIDDVALIEALASRKVRAAGLDAFHEEPLTGEHRWCVIPNTTLTPHVGGVSEDAYVNMGTAAARNVLDVLSRQAA